MTTLQEFARAAMEDAITHRVLAERLQTQVDELEATLEGRMSIDLREFGNRHALARVQRALAAGGSRLNGDLRALLVGQAVRYANTIERRQTNRHITPDELAELNASRRRHPPR